MKAVVLIRILSIVTLLFNAASGFYGGALLIIHPDGSALGLPMEYLANSGFSSYLVPGLFLISVNGILALIVAIVTIMHHNNEGTFIFMQGFLSTLFIAIEIAVIKQFSMLQVVYGSIGVLLFILGFTLLLTERRSSQLPKAK